MTAVFDQNQLDNDFTDGLNFVKNEKVRYCCGIIKRILLLLILIAIGSLKFFMNIVFGAQ